MKITLYHGSKSGLSGDIQPISRETCDFGKGFYMGTEEKQPLTLICNFPGARMYKLSAELTDLRVLDIDVGIEWALLIAFHRKKMESFTGSDIYQNYSEMLKGYDMVAGYIANDRMFLVLDRFFAGEITDVALVNSLSALKLGKQYVALSESACRRIKILEEKILSEAERSKLLIESEGLRLEGIRQADEICRKYRREGRFFDEIMDGGV